MPQIKAWAGKLPWAYGLVCVPVIALWLVCLGNAYFDLQRVRTAVLRNQIEPLRLAAKRRAAGFEALLDSQDATPESWDELRAAAWVKKFWSACRPEVDQQLYFAVIDDTGTIVMHTDPQQVGEQIGRGWYERRIPEACTDVVRVGSGALSGRVPAYDVSVPLTASDHVNGELHAGVDATWLEAHIAQQQHAQFVSWAWLFTFALVVSALAVTGLVQLAKREQNLVERLQQQSGRHSEELSRLGGGLAHEVRNPLHALRINTHILRRAIERPDALPQAELVTTTKELDTAVDRVEAVLRDLLQYVDQSPGNVAEIDLAYEVSAVLGLMADGLQRDQIAVTTSHSLPTAMICMDAVRLRQILQNILNFVQLRAGQPGKIEVALARAGDSAELAIVPGGDTLTEDQAAHLFEPFRAPVEKGSGLSLALVRAHLATVGGSVRCEQQPRGRDRFVLNFPLSRRASQGKAS